MLNPGDVSASYDCDGSAVHAARASECAEGDRLAVKRCEKGGKSGWRLP
jgi:hypothetical protein